MLQHKQSEDLILQTVDPGEFCTAPEDDYYVHNAGA